MYSKIINPVKHGNVVFNNKESSLRLGNYLDKERSKKEGTPPNGTPPEGKDKDIFFNSEGNFSKKQVVEAIDNNIKGLTKKDDKFHSLVIAPSAKELEHIGNNTAKLKEFTIACMEKYAANFNLNSGKRLSEKDLVWYATIHQNRAYKGTDTEVLNGEKKSGDLKEGLQTHIHIVVSARDKEQKTTLNPNTPNNNRFKMTTWFENNQKQFNQQFDFKPEPKEVSKPKDKTAYFILWTEKKLHILEKMGITDKQITEIRNFAKSKNNSSDFRKNLGVIIKEVRANENPKNKHQQQKHIPISPVQMKLLENSVAWHSTGRNSVPFKKQSDLELPSPSKSIMAEFKGFRYIFENLNTEDFNKNQDLPKRKKKRNLNQEISL